MAQSCAASVESLHGDHPNEALFRLHEHCTRLTEQVETLREKNDGLIKSRKSFIDCATHWKGKAKAAEAKLDAVEGLPDFALLRPMQPNDVVVGKTIFLIDNTDDGRIHVRTVDEVLKPDDPWKAYCANDGCRYGLDGVYVIGTDDDLQQALSDKT